MELQIVIKQVRDVFPLTFRVITEFELRRAIMVFEEQGVPYTSHMLAPVLRKLGQNLDRYIFLSELCSFEWSLFYLKDEPSFTPLNAQTKSHVRLNSSAQFLRCEYSILQFVKNPELDWSLMRHPELIAVWKTHDIRFRALTPEMAKEIDALRESPNETIEWTSVTETRQELLNIGLVLSEFS